MMTKEDLNDENKLSAVIFTNPPVAVLLWIGNFCSL